MPVSLLATKLHLPQPRPGLVSRPRLIERLAEGLQPGKRLILISAPAGYGKTTLLCQWARNLAVLPTQPAAVRWISLDEADNDPARFWAYVYEALRETPQEQGRSGLLYTGQSDLPEPGQLADLQWQEIIHRLLSRPPQDSQLTLLVLDDFHLIHNPNIHTLLKNLIRSLPAHLRVVVACRADPPLGLAAMRGRGELTEVRLAELGFSLPETEELLNRSLNLSLSDHDLEILHGKTEGWASGLQMAGLALRTLLGQPEEAIRFIHDFSGSQRYVLGYLLEEVLTQQPERIQDFLLKTAFLKTLSGPLCEAVTGRPDSQEVLEQLERDNLFIFPLDQHQAWYRYHSLLSGLLRQRARRAFPPEEIIRLYERAAAYFEEHDCPAEAVETGLEGLPGEAAVQIFERNATQIFFRGQTGLLHTWFKALPADAYQDRLLLLAVRANTLMLAEPCDESIAQAELWLEHIKKSRRQVTEAACPADYPESELDGFIANFQTYLARYRSAPPEQIVQLCHQALAQLAPDQNRYHSPLSYNLGLAYFHLGQYEEARKAWTSSMNAGQACGDLFNALASAHGLAYLARMQGQLQQASSLCQAALEMGGFHDGSRRALPAMAGGLYIELGKILVEWNELDRAAAYLQKGLDLIFPPVSHQSQVEGLLYLARVKTGQGDFIGAAQLAAQAENIPSPAARLAAPYQARLWLRQAGFGPSDRRLMKWLEKHPLSAATQKYDEAQLTSARLVVFLARSPGRAGQEQMLALGDFLEHQLQAARTRGWRGWEVELLILRALAHQARQADQAAFQDFNAALELGAPAGYLRTYLDFGPAAADLLRQVLEAGLLPEHSAYLKRLAAAFEMEYGAEQHAKGVASPQEQPLALIEPLSPRELEVLGLVCQGLSNEEIARKLVLSLNTVKKHNYNLFQKLGVTTRAQAIHLAHQLGLYPSKTG